MPNPAPEKRVGLALLIIGGFALYIFLLAVWAGNAPHAGALAAIVLTLLAGWGLRERFKKAGGPPSAPPSPPAAPKRGGPGLPLGRKKAPPPAPPPPPPKPGPLDFLKPRTKGPPRK